MQTEKSQPSGQRIINAGNSVNLVSAIIRLPSGWNFSVCIGDDVRFYFTLFHLGQKTKSEIVVDSRKGNKKLKKNLAVCY